jgi:transposase
MKKIFFISLLLVIASCKTKKTISDKTDNSTTVTIVAAADVDAFKKNRAFDLGNRLLETCNTSKFKVFTPNEATIKVINNATVEKIAATCKKINLRNGKYLGMQLIDITYYPKSNEHVFRYMISYEKKLYKRELFVTLNEDSKVSAISTKEINPKPM